MLQKARRYGFTSTLHCFEKLLEQADELPLDALHTVFQAVVVNKLTYATPAWYGFTTAADRGRIDSFLRRSVKLGYRHASLPSFDSMCAMPMNYCFLKSSTTVIIYCIRSSPTMSTALRTERAST